MEGSIVGGQDLGRWRERVLAEKRRLERQAQRMRRAALADAETGGIGELSLYDQHPADLGSELAARQTDLGLEQNIDRMLRQVNRALKRIEEGTYGVCERCGGPIEKERLEAAPYVTTCVACQQQEEARGRGKANLSGRRPAEEELLSPPFGRSFRDDQAAYDGEDVWDDLAQHGTSNTPQDDPRPD